MESKEEYGIVRQWVYAEEDCGGEGVIDMPKTRNAIIMSAGTSSRFAPLSYEKPKGLWRVRGEVLIERQIEQLKAAGIHDITVVTGYMAEKFCYLKEKYGVDIVCNRDYYRYNNTSTLMCVLDRISDTFICSSDNYFTENVFKDEAAQAYYATVYGKGETQEWCVDSDADGRICKVTIGGKDAWYMLGHAYFSPEFSEKFKEILNREYAAEGIREVLWEEVYRRHADELLMYIRKYDTGIVNEFDRLEELRDFDDTYRDNSGSVIMGGIKRLLCCAECDIVEIEPLTGGLTNQNFKFSCKGKQYVYRSPGEGTEELIDRKSEEISTRLAVELGIDAELIYFDADAGTKISVYIPDAQTMTGQSICEEKNMKDAAGILHKLHTCGRDTGVEFDVFAMALKYETIIRENKIRLFTDYKEVKSFVYELKRELDREKQQLVPCHNDPLCANWVRGSDRLYLIDWEYAGMNEALWDVADISIEADMTADQEMKLLRFYYDREPSVQEKKRFDANKIFIDYLWTLWGKTRVPFDGENMEQYAAERYRRLKENLNRIGKASETENE